MSAIESSVCKRVGFAILLARDMLNGEVAQGSRQFSSAFVKRPEILALDLIPALHVRQHEFGVAAYAQGMNGIRLVVIKRGNQCVVFGNIVRLPADALR